MKMKAMLIAALMACANVHAGWYFESATKAEGTTPEQGKAMSSVTRTWIDGDSIRSEFVSSGNPVMPAGSYIVSRDGGATMTLVNPVEKTYATMDVAAMAGGAMKMMGGMMKMANPKVETLLDEDDGKLLGYPVRHYRFKTSYTMEVNVFGMKHSTATETLQDLWASTAIGDAGTAFWKNRNVVSSGDEALDKMIKGEFEKIKGLPLKQVTVTRNTDSRGTTELTMSMEVTSIKDQKLGENVFKLPEGYTETSFMAMAAGSAQQQQQQRGTEAGETKTPPPAAQSFLEMMKKLKQPAK